MKGIEKVKRAQKTYTLSDFKSKTARAINLNFSKNGIKSSSSVSQINLSIPFDTSPESIHYLDERLFFKYNDGLYELKESGDGQSIQKQFGKLCATVIKVSGQNRILFADDNGNAVLHGQSGFSDVSMPKTTSMAVVKDRLFSAYQNCVTAHDGYDFEEATIPLTPYATFNTSSSDGKILQLCEYKDCLYVFCESAIYRIISDTESIDFILEKICSSPIKILENSVKRNFDKIFFISNGILYAFDGQKISSVNCLMNNKIKKCNGITKKDGKLIISYLDNDDQMGIFVYDTVSGEEEFLGYSTDKIADNGIILSENLLFSLFEDEGEFSGGEWISKRLTAGEIGAKNLVKISAYVGSKCLLTLVGENGEKKITLKKGNNTFMLNYDTTDFCLKLTWKDKEFFVKNITLKYTVRG